MYGLFGNLTHVDAPVCNSHLCECFSGILLTKDEYHAIIFDNEGLEIF